MKNNQFIKELVFANIAKGFHNIEDIATQSGGIYPSELISILNTLIDDGKIYKNENGLYLVNTNPNNPIQIILPEPHPLDFDWRFEPTSSKMIMEHLIRENNYYGTILLLGAPSIFVEFMKLENPPKVKLIDWNKEVIDYINTFNYHNNLSCHALDLSNKHIINTNNSVIKNYESVDVLFFDPPWYVNDYNFFLSHAANLTKIGGAVMMVLMPLNTRPKAYSDRCKIFSIAKKLGLYLEFIEKNSIVYQTPLFEKKSLLNDGIKISKNWRHGDLVLLRKIHKPNKNINMLQSMNRNIETKNWISFLIRGHKVKINSNNLESNVEPELISIEKNNILKTVSQRYIKRSKVDLWLWDNRVYSLKGGIYFINALYSLSNLDVPNKFQTSNINYINKALTLLRKILLLE